MSPELRLDTVLGSVQEWLDRLRRGWPHGALHSPRKAIIEALPLRRSEAAVRPLPMSMDAPRTLALRRIHIVNRGPGTVLRDWEVWITTQDRRRPDRARVMTHAEWVAMGTVVADLDVPILCQGDVLSAPKGMRMRRDVPFLVEGMLPDEVVACGNDVRVQFKDRANRKWAYDSGSTQSVRDDRSARSGAGSFGAAWRGAGSRGGR